MNDHNITGRVLAKIETGEISMRSRARLSLQVAALAALAILAALLAVYVASFALFTLHESGEQFLLGFGARGVNTFLALFPWGTLTVLLALLLVLGYLLRRFRMGYRTPILLAFGSIVLGSVIFGFALSRTGLHAFLLDQADSGALPLIGALYENIHESHRGVGVYRGIVEQVGTSTFVIGHDDHDQDMDDGPRTIVAPAGFDPHTLKPGDHVFVAGGASGAEAEPVAPAPSGSSMSTGAAALSTTTQNTVEAYGVEPYEGE